MPQRNNVTIGEAANLKEKDVYVYFLYSETQEKERKAIEARMGKLFIPGVVVVNGQRSNFTELSRKNNNRYSDTRVVAEGWKSKMVYTNISTRMGR